MRYPMRFVRYHLVHENVFFFFNEKIFFDITLVINLIISSHQVVWSEDGLFKIRFLIRCIVCVSLILCPHDFFDYVSLWFFDNDSQYQKSSKLNAFHMSERFSTVTNDPTQKKNEWYVIWRHNKSYRLKCFSSLFVLVTELYGRRSE